MNIISPSFKLVLLLLMLSQVNCIYAANSSTPMVSNGVLDLRNFDLNENPNLPLNGDWDFYWGEFISLDLSDLPSKKIAATVPSVWNNYKKDGVNLPGKGFGSYKLKILLNENHPKDIALKLLAINSSFKLFVNGEEMASSGVTSTTPLKNRDKYKPTTVFLERGTDVLDIVIHVSNYSLKRGGLRERIEFGTSEALLELRERSVLFELFLFGAIFIIGIQYIVIFLVRRKEVVYVYFAAICIAIALRTLVLGERYLLHMFPQMSMGVMQFFAIGLIIITIVTFVYYIKTLFPAYLPNWVPKSILIIAAPQMFIILLGNPYLSSYMIIPMQVTGLLALISVLVVVVRVSIHREAGANIILLSTIIVTMATVNDILYDRSLSPFINLLPIGLFLFLFAQTIFLSRRTAMIQRNIERLSENIKNTNIALKKFVPHEFLYHLKRDNITDIKLGDQVHKQMSILFSDIRSFTAMSEKMSPQENFNFINSYLDKIWPAIEKNRGFVDKYVGDAVMALFAYVKDDAIKAAVDMQKMVGDFNRLPSRKECEPISIGIGVHTGNLMLGTIGHTNRMETTVISDAVNLAARMEGLTKLYGAGIITSKAALDLCVNQDRYHTRSLDTVSVRGKSDTVELIEILDGLSADQFNKKTETLDSFKFAIAAYKAGQMIKAKEIFTQVLDINCDDLAAKFYLERCDTYIKDGVPQDWDGVQVFKS